MLSTATPFSFILFGASGHLAKQKIYPAIYTLALKKRLPENFAIVGYARTEMTDASFRELVKNSIKAQMLEINEKKVDAFLEHVRYHQGQYDKVADFEALAGKLQTLEQGWGQTVRLAYFSIPPVVFPAVVENICNGKVKADGPFRCIVEKPVGDDVKSFEVVREQLQACFRDDEIYLLDHYLGKEAVRNIYYLRFANPILERLFKNSLIHHVEVAALESAGIEGRAGYFDSTGTFRDMFQSHLLMMSSLLTMHIKDTDDGIRGSRLNALMQFYLPPATSLGDIALQGQYAGGAINGETVVGYADEESVKQKRTNTYAALKLQSRESRWQGVPFYLRSGKRLGKKETRISLRFQEPRAVGPGSAPNRLDIILQGEAGMRIFLQTKLGGTEPAFRPLVLTDPLVCMGDCLPEHGLLLLEAIHGKQTWFLTFEEIRTAWRLVDPVQSYLSSADTPLYSYTAGSDGPEEAKGWIAKDSAEWY